MSAYRRGQICVRLYPELDLNAIQVDLGEFAKEAF